MSSENWDVLAITCARDTGVGGNDCGVHMKAPPPALMRPSDGDTSPSSLPPLPEF